MKTSTCIAVLLAIVSSVWLPATSLAAPYGKYNQSHLDWKVTETKYFRFYFTEETPNTLSNESHFFEVEITPRTDC